MINAGHSDHTALLEHPLSESNGQLFVTATLVSLVVGAERALHRGLEEVIAEKVQRADKDNAGVVASLQTTYQQGGLSNRVWVLNKKIICSTHF